LLGDDQLIALSREFLLRGMKLYRDEDGVFLEHGGGDSSYQAVCLLRLQEIVCTWRIAARGLPTRRRRAWGGTGGLGTRAAARRWQRDWRTTTI
jgi:hypothetical protein